MVGMGDRIGSVVGLHWPSLGPRRDKPSPFRHASCDACGKIAGSSRAKRRLRITSIFGKGLRRLAFTPSGDTTRPLQRSGFVFSGPSRFAASPLKSVRTNRRAPRGAVVREPESASSWTGFSRHIHAVVPARDGAARASACRTPSTDPPRAIQEPKSHCQRVRSRSARILSSSASAAAAPALRRDRPGRLGVERFAQRPPRRAPHRVPPAKSAPGGSVPQLLDVLAKTSRDARSDASDCPIGGPTGGGTSGGMLRASPRPEH